MSDERVCRAHTNDTAASRKTQGSLTDNSDDLNTPYYLVGFVGAVRAVSA
jgi:hypothetical protein